MDDIDPEALAIMTDRARRQIRKRLRAVRAAVPARARAIRSQKIVSRLLDLDVWAGSRSVAMYWADDDRGEVSLEAADEAARKAGKDVSYPFVRTEETAGVVGFRRVERTSSLGDRGHGFFEPPEGLPDAKPGEIDLIVVPAIAIAETGHRLGYGSGFYDRVLPMFRPPAKAVVVGYGFQLVAEIPPGEHDVACDAVVTDELVFDPGGVL